MMSGRKKLKGASDWEVPAQAGALRQERTFVRPIVSDVAKEAGRNSLWPAARGPSVTVISSRSGALTSYAPPTAPLITERCQRVWRACSAPGGELGSCEEASVRSPSRPSREGFEGAR